MPEVVGVAFRRAGKPYYFDRNSLDLKPEDLVIVETVRGTELGRVVVGLKHIEESEITGELKKVLRIAGEKDLESHYENRLVAAEALRICRKKIREHALAMKLVDVEYTLDGSKIVFYFSADGRVDFRNLVRELAVIFKRRIELHQIGVRDEAKIIGGLGPCGRPVCCASFMPEFAPVSIKMAKEQNISLNPERISGACGRFMCCLKYEYDVYHESLKRYPPIGSTVMLAEGEAVVVEHSVPKDMIIAELPSKVRVSVPFRELAGGEPAAPAQTKDAGRSSEKTGGSEKSDRARGGVPAGKRGFRPTSQGARIMMGRSGAPEAENGEAACGSCGQKNGKCSRESRPLHGAAETAKKAEPAKNADAAPQQQEGDVRKAPRKRRRRRHVKGSAPRAGEEQPS